MTAHAASIGAPVTCKSCGAPIRWARTPSGKATPLDADPIATGEVVLDGGIARHVDLLTETDGPRYRVHWATCPQADSHRKARS